MSSGIRKWVSLKAMSLCTPVLCREHIIPVPEQFVPYSESGNKLISESIAVISRFKTLGVSVQFVRINPEQIQIGGRAEGF